MAKFMHMLVMDLKLVRVLEYFMVRICVILLLSLIMSILCESPAIFADLPHSFPQLFIH